MSRVTISEIERLTAFYNTRDLFLNSDSFHFYDNNMNIMIIRCGIKVNERSRENLLFLQKDDFIGADRVLNLKMKIEYHQKSL